MKNELLKKLIMEQLFQIYLKNGIKDVEKTEESLAININKLAVPFDGYLDRNGNPRHFIPLPVKELEFKIVFPDGSIVTNTKLVRVSLRAKGEEILCCRCEVFIYRNMEERKDGLYVVKHEKDFLLSELYNKMPNANTQEQVFEALRPYAVSITVSHALTKLGIGLGVDSIEEDMDLATSSKTENESFVPVDEVVDTKIIKTAEDFTEMFDDMQEQTKQDVQEQTEQEEKPAKKPRGRKKKNEVIEDTVAETTTEENAVTEESTIEETLVEEAVAEETVEETVSPVEETVTEDVVAEIPIEEIVAEETVEETVSPVEETVTEDVVAEISVEEPIIAPVEFPTDDGVQTSLFEQDATEESIKELSYKEALAFICQTGKHAGNNKTLGEILETDPTNFKFLYNKAINRMPKQEQVAMKKIVAENKDASNLVGN